MPDATLIEGATEPGAHLSVRDAAAAIANLRRQPEPKLAQDKASAPKADEPPTDTGAPDEAPTDSAPDEPGTDTKSQDAQDPAQAAAPETDKAAVDLPTVAKALGLTEDDLIVSDDGTVSIKTKVDGQDGTVKPADLRKSYQLESSFTHKSMQLAEERKQFQQEREAEVQKIVGRQQELDTALKVAAQYLHGQYARMTPEAWAKLQAEDPIGYLATKDQYEQHMRGLQALHSTLTKGEQEKLQKQQQDYHAWARQQAQDVVNHIPEWKDAKVAQKDLDGIFSTAKADYGITQPELDQLIDSRYVRILKDAVSWRQLQSKNAGVMKQVNAAPTLARPGSGQKSNKTSEQQARERFQNSRSEKDAAALLSALRKRK
jgi:hypothetical protein